MTRDHVLSPLTSILNLPIVGLLLFAVRSVMRFTIIARRFQGWLVRDAAALGEMQSVLRDLLLLLLRDVIPVGRDVRFVAEEGTDFFQRPA